MVINSYAKKWCEEDYDIKKEDFYVENAYYIAKRQWAKAALKHAIIPILMFLFTFVFCVQESSSMDALKNALFNGGVFTAAFWFFGIRKYDANDPWASKGIYVALPILLFLTRFRVSDVWIWLFGIGCIPLFLYLTVYRYIDYYRAARKIKKRIIEEEKEEADASQQSYEKWKNQYKTYRFGIPETIVHDDDPLLTQARELFVGYTDNPQALKTRFRQLLKQHHPDAGGDTEFCQRIIKVYEEYQKTFA